MALKDGMVKAGVGLGIVSFVLILLTTALPYWRVSDPVASDPFMSQIKSVEGLWIRCTSSYHEYYSCDWYDTALIGLPAYINGFRALMVVAMIASFAGFIMSIFGLSCLSALEDESRNKRMLVLAAGGVQITAGLMTCLCVSWYASEVVREFNNTLLQDTRQIAFTFGSCLYLGWIAFAVSVAAGCLLLCCHLRSDDDDDRGIYKPTTTNNIPMNRPYQVNSTPIYTKNTYEEKRRRSREYSREARNSRNYDEDRTRSYNHHHSEKTSSKDDGYV